MIKKIVTTASAMAVLCANYAFANPQMYDAASTEGMLRKGVMHCGTASFTKQYMQESRHFVKTIYGNNAAEFERIAATSNKVPEEQIYALSKQDCNSWLIPQAKELMATRKQQLKVSADYMNSQKNRK